jgi:restriction system protein
VLGNDHLKKAAVIENTRRGHFCITPRGTELLTQKIERIDLSLLGTFPEYIEFKNLSRPKEEEPAFAKSLSEDGKTPDELLYDSYKTIRETLATDILENVKSCSPLFFERLVVELLVKMGYGGTLEDAGQAVGRSGDGGN